jgi:hypothetical protein
VFLNPVFMITYGSCIAQTPAADLLMTRRNVIHYTRDVERIG